MLLAHFEPPAVSGGSLDTAVDAPWDLGLLSAKPSLSTLSYHRRLQKEQGSGRKI